MGEAKRAVEEGRKRLAKLWAKGELRTLANDLFTNEAAIMAPEANIAYGAAGTQHHSSPLDSWLERILTSLLRSGHFSLSGLDPPESCFGPPDSRFRFAGASKTLQRLVSERGFAVVSLSEAEVAVASNGVLVTERGAYKFSDDERQILETGK